MKLDGKTALVTGAARGIGKASAVCLAQGGADVALNDLNEDGLAAVAEEIRGLGRQVLLLPGDVSDQPGVEKMVGEVTAAWGHLDMAVANACFSDRESFYTANMEGFRRTIDVTMWGAFYVLRAAANQMIAQGTGGSVVAISSPHAEIAIAGSMAYNMAKAAVDHMVRTAALELINHRIRVNAIHPGWIDTPGERKFISDEDLAAAAANLPWGRLGKPEEIGRTVAFLCDPESDYITGSTFKVDGGITLPWYFKKTAD